MAPSSRLIVPLIAVVCSLAVARTAPAQQLRPLFANDVVTPGPRALPSLAGQPRRYSTWRLIGGGVAGGVIGAAIGGLVGAAVVADQTNDTNEELWIDTSWGAVVGGAAGESVGLATGVFLANGRQGNLLISMVASCAIGGIGFALLSENGEAPFGPILVAVTPIAQLAATIGIERRTSR